MIARTTRFEQAGLVGSYHVPRVRWAQLEPGRFEIGFEVLDAPPVRLSERRLNLGMQVDAEVLPGKIVVGCVNDPTSTARCFGSDIDTSHVVVTKREINPLTTGPASYCNVAIDEAALARQFASNPDTEALLNSRSTTVARDPIVAHRLRASVKWIFLLRHLADSDFLPWGIPPRTIAGSLVPILANAIERHDANATVPSICRSRRYKAVRSCEAYMCEHLDASITLLDLSAVAGMRSHSLINAFVAVTGLSPIEYLKRLRLNRCHHDLLHADRSRTRVTQVATNWGFWHMGHFAYAYKSMYGETPSQTLGRRRE